MGCRTTPRKHWLKEWSKKCFWNSLKIIQGKGNEKVLKRSFQRSHSEYARKFSSLVIFFFSQLGSKEYSVHTRHSSLSFGQAAVSFCLPGATSCSSYKLIISLGVDLPTPFANWASKLKTLLAQQENLLVPNYRTDLFSCPVHSPIFFARLSSWVGDRPLGHSVELLSYKIKTAASQSRPLTSKAARKISDCIFSLVRKLKWVLHPYRVRTVNFDRFPLVAFFMSSATVHMVGKALLVFICPRFSRAFSTSSWLAEKYMTSFSSGSPWNLAEISSFSRSHSCFFMTRISTEFPCLNTSSENKIEKKNELTNTGTTCWHSYRRLVLAASPLRAISTTCIFSRAELMISRVFMAPVTSFPRPGASWIFSRVR